MFERTEEIDSQKILAQFQSQQRPNYCIETLYQQYSKEPEAIKYIISNAPSSEHLVYIFKKLCSDHEREHYDHASFCLKQEKFPKDPIEYLTIAGVTFYQSASKLLLLSGNYVVVIRDQEAYLDLFDQIFKYVPTLVSSVELEELSASLIYVYEESKERLLSGNYTELPQFNSSYKEMRESLFTLRTVLEKIIDHPHYPFLPASQDLKTPWRHPSSRGYLWSRKCYPFYFAAENGCKNIFNRFYFDEDTPEEAKKSAINIVLKKPNFYTPVGQINNLKGRKFSSEIPGEDERSEIIPFIGYQLNKLSIPIFILLLEEMSPLNRDIACLIASFLLPLKSQICASYLTENAEPPKSYFFAKASYFGQREPISHGWLISRAIAKTKEYINIEEREYKSNDEDLYHALAFIKIFCNHKLLMPLKMLALYALLNEKPSSFQTLFNSKNLRTALEPFFKPYLQTVKQAAEDYARANKMTLEGAEEGLVRLVNKRKDKMESTDIFWTNTHQEFHNMMFGSNKFEVLAIDLNHEKIPEPQIGQASVQQKLADFHHLYNAKLKEDQAAWCGLYGVFARSNVNQSMSLQDLVNHAQGSGYRTLRVMEKLKWFNENNELSEDMRELVKSKAI